VCYPAQGFALLGKADAPIDTPYGSIAARRLSTSLGSRKEPVTYWFNVGDTPVSNQLEQRWVELRLGLLGQVPDGLLFRVSSIDDDTPRAYRMQDVFVLDLLKAVDETARMRLAGLRGARSKPA
jgi:EpsI family protein